MTAKISEISNTNIAVGFQAVNNNSCNSTYLSMANYERAKFIIGHLNGTGNIAVQMRQSTTSNAVNSTTVSTVSNANITSANGIGEVEVRASEMNVAGGYTHAGVRVYEYSTLEVNVAGVCIRTHPRYPQATALP